MPRGAGLAVAALLAVGLTGCTELDYALTKIPFLSFMDSSPAFDPYEAPRPAPEGSVPFASPAETPSAYGEIGLTEPERVAFGERVQNPVPADEAALAHGQELYIRHCAVCHGATGVGNGPVVGAGKFPFATNLTVPPASERAGGYIYAVIATGRGLMPSYRRIPPMERWYIVNYVQSLRQGGPAAQPAATTAAPATGGE